MRLPGSHFRFLWQPNEKWQNDELFKYRKAISLKHTHTDTHTHTHSSTASVNNDGGNDGDDDDNDELPESQIAIQAKLS